MSKWIIANLKMNKDLDELKTYANALKALVSGCENNIAVCPNFVCINSMVKAFKNTKIVVGAQNCHEKEEGSFTGEVSVKMLKSAGAEFVILGHSERRRFMGENDELVNRKLLTVLNAGLKAVVCLADDGSDGFENNIKLQLNAIFKGVDSSFADNIMLAFEPVWAIGSGSSMAANDIASVTKVIKQYAKNIMGKDIKVLYGGSVNSLNAKEILAINSVDGLLVGTASKDPVEFSRVCNAQ